MYLVFYNQKSKTAVFLTRMMSLSNIVAAQNLAVVRAKKLKMWRAETAWGRQIMSPMLLDIFQLDLQAEVVSA